MTLREKFATAAAVIICLALAACATQTQRQADTAGPILITVTGAIGETNRPRFGPFRDAFFNFRNAPFEAAYEFDYATLAALGMQEITTKYPNWEHEVTVRGPRVADILTVVGATGDTVAFQALDGYTAEFNRNEIAQSPAILAIADDTGPLGVGGRGPGWLVFAPGDIPGQRIEDDAALVWAVYLIHVE